MDVTILKLVIGSVILAFVVIEMSSKIAAITLDKKYLPLGGIISGFFWRALRGIGWWFVGLLAFISIVGIPWGRACFVIGQFSFFPFGSEAINRKDLTSKDDVGTGGFGVVGNIIWFIFAGVWLALGHVVSAILCFFTIIGIPFGIQHLKLAGIALAPIGKTIVTKEVAAAARNLDAETSVAKLRAST